MNHKTIKTYCKIIIIGAIFLAFSTIFFSYLVGVTESYRDSAKENYKELEFENLYGILLYNLDQAKLESQITSDEIEYNIRNAYPENKLNKLETLLENNVFPDDLLDIFSDSIKNKTYKNLSKPGNSIFIANLDGIICDLDIDKDSNSTNNSIVRHWNDEVLLHQNAILTQNAIDKLIDQSNEIIIWDIGNDEYFKNGKVTKSEIRRLYDDKGIEGFRDYEFLCAAYINEYTDIFGKEDIVGTKYNKTHKFIVVQKLNLYDLFTTKYQNIMDDSLYQEINKGYTNILGGMYILGIFLCLSFIGAIFVITIFFNKSLDNK